jgi:hypothetical protein
MVMPQNPHDLYNFGLFPRTEMPSSPVYKVLVHLNEPGSPRLYVEERPGGYLSAALSNTESTAGRTTKTDVRTLIEKQWVVIDPSIRQVGRMKVYMLSNAGREIIAQYDAYQYIDNIFLPSHVPKILARFRKKAGAPDPATR